MGSLTPEHYLTVTRKSYATPRVYFGNCTLDLMCHRGLQCLIQLRFHINPCDGEDIPLCCIN